MDRRLLLVGLLVLVLVLGACGAPGDSASTGDDAAGTTVVETDYGPFLVEDRFEVVTALSWLDLSPALEDGPIRDGGPVAVLLDDSTSETLHIAVNSGGCVPRVNVSVLQPPPELQLGIEVGGGIHAAGIQCTDLLTTHAFELRLAEPVNLDAVVFNPVLPEGGEQALIVLPGVEGSPPGDVMLSCPGGPSFPARALDYIPAVEEVDMPELIAEMQRFLSDPEGQYWPQDNWRILDHTDDRVLVAHYDQTTDVFAFMDFEYQGGSLRWVGASQGGSCPLQTTLPDGLGVVTWRIDPDAEPLSADAMSIPVLVKERACASGEPMRDRLVGPEVAMTDTEVLITFAAENQTTGQTCPDNPETRVVVELTEPLGDRTLRDGLDTGLNLADFFQ